MVAQEGVKKAIPTLTIGKQLGIDNIQTQLSKYCGSETAKTQANLPKDMEQKTVAERLDPVLHNTIFSKERKSTQICKSYRTISIIIHTNKVMLRELLNRIKQKYEEILCKKQAGLRTRRGTSQQIFNIRVLTDSHLQHQCDFYTITLQG